MTVALRGMDLPEVVSADLIMMITDTIANQPRTLQTAIGPSEIGIPCTRRLIHKIAHDPEPGRQDPAWLAYIGSCVHAGLELGMRRHPLNQAIEQPRFLLEQRVHVGTAGGHEIWGNADVFDIDSGTVIDWKVCGPQRITDYARLGPGQQYRTQAHLYGRGFAAQGFMVNTVMIMFLPRNDQLYKHHMWAEPYDEGIALEALSRLDGLYELLGLFGAQALAETYPPCKDWFCQFCRADRKKVARTVKTIDAPSTTAELFG